MLDVQLLPEATERLGQEHVGVHEADEIVSRPIISLVASSVIFVVALLSIAFWANSRTVLVVGPSMEPTHPNGTRLVACHAYWLVGKINRNDVVAFADPADSSDSVIKRVVALGGDRVDSSFAPAEWPQRVEYRVPLGQIYVLGDNRAVSEDSRVFGPIFQDQVIGKCVHLWGGSMTLPFIVGIGAILAIVSLWIVLRYVVMSRQA